jgi:hypothetical protein
VVDIKCCAGEIYSEPCHSARLAIPGLPRPAASAASRKPAQAIGDHPSGSGMAAPTKA